MSGTLPASGPVFAVEGDGAAGFDPVQAAAASTSEMKKQARNKDIAQRIVFYDWKPFRSGRNAVLRTRSYPDVAQPESALSRLGARDLLVAAQSDHHDRRVFVDFQCDVSALLPRFRAALRAGGF